MSCQNCNSRRLLHFSGKCDDRFNCQVGDHGVDCAYVPGDLGIGSGDYIRGDLCLDCGTLQGEWPLPTSDMEASPLETDIVDEDDCDGGEYFHHN